MTDNCKVSREGRNIHFETRGGKPLCRGAAARIDRAATRSFDGALRGGSRGPMTETREGSVLAMLELWNLHNRLSVEDKGCRQYIEAVSAVVALPDRLQRYLDNCTFRRERTNKTIETEEQEIKAMQNALKGSL